MTALVFDFGLKHIGVAVALPAQDLARALTTIRAAHGDPLWRDLDALIAEWRPTLLVVGEALNMDGTASDMAMRARCFGNRLHDRYALPVAYADERLTTFEAVSRGADARSSHALAAQVIGETWLGGR